MKVLFISCLCIFQQCLGVFVIISLTIVIFTACETRHWDDIAFYFRWLACDPRLMYPQLPERVMR